MEVIVKFKQSQRKLQEKVPENIENRHMSKKKRSTEKKK